MSLNENGLKMKKKRMRSGNSLLFNLKFVNVTYYIIYRRGPQKSIHRLIEVIYAHKHKVEPKCNVKCLV
jgi:hypothetical protein